MRGDATRSAPSQSGYRPAWAVASSLPSPICAACSVYVAGVVCQKLALRYASAFQVTTFGCFTGTAVCLPFAGQLLSPVGAPYNPRGHNLRRFRHPGMGTSVLAE